MPLYPARNLNFYNVKDYGAKVDGVTSDSAAIASLALNLSNASGGVIFIPEGVCRAHLPIYSKVHYIGGGIEATVVKPEDGANTDVFYGTVNGYTGSVLTNIAAANATGSTGGVYNWSISNLTIDGNKTNQSGTSWGLRQYGFGFILQNLRVRNCLSGGLYSDWNGGSGGTIDGMDAQVSNVKIHDCGGVGFKWAGPHDSQVNQTLSYNNDLHCFHIGPNATAMLFSSCHGYGPKQGVTGGAVGWLAEGGYMQCVNCVSEGSDTCNVAVLAGDLSWVGCHIFGIAGSTPLQAQVGMQLGQTAGGTPYSGSVNQSGGVTTAWQTTGCIIDGNFSLNNGGAISFANESNNMIHAITYNASASGNVTVGSPSVSTNCWITANGPTADGTFAKGGGINAQIKANQALHVGDRTNDVFNINTSSPSVSLVGNAPLRQFSDQYGTEVFRLDASAILRWYSSGVADVVLKRGASGVLVTNNAFATGITSGSAQVPSSSGTITLGSPPLGIIRVAPTGNITGVILGTGSFGGQGVTIINESAFTVTFAASGTSNVAQGTSKVVPANDKITMVWDNGSGQNLWY